MTGVVSRRDVVKRLGLFVVLFAVTAWPWNTVSQGFSAAMSSALNPLLSQTTFEGQTHISVAPLDRPGSAASAARAAEAHQNVVADTALTLRLTKYAGQMQLQLTLRRDIYLPWMLFVTLLLASPLPWRPKVIGIVSGSTLIFMVGIGTIYLLLGNVFSGRLPLAPQLSEVYVVSDVWGDTLQFLHERWSTPPGNRVIAPLLLAAGFIVGFWPNRKSITTTLAGAAASTGELARENAAP